MFRVPTTVRRLSLPSLFVACVFFIIAVVCYPVHKHVNQTVAERRLLLERDSAGCVLVVVVCM